MTTIMRKANLNSFYAALCIDILVKSNLLRVVDQSIGNPRQNNNSKTYHRYVKTLEGKVYIDLFDEIQKMVVNFDEDPKHSCVQAQALILARSKRARAWRKSGEWWRKRARAYPFAPIEEKVKKEPTDEKIKEPLPPIIAGRANKAT